MLLVGSLTPTTGARTMAVNLAVTNDAAESGAKLCAEFKDSVKSKMNLQTILQTVQRERNKKTKHEKQEIRAYWLVPY